MITVGRTRGDLLFAVEDNAFNTQTLFFLFLDSPFALVHNISDRRG